MDETTDSTTRNKCFVENKLERKKSNNDFFKIWRRFYSYGFGQDDSKWMKPMTEPPEIKSLIRGFFKSQLKYKTDELCQYSR